MIQRELTNLRAGVSVAIDKAKQATDFVEAEPDLAATPHEVQAPEMVGAINTVSVRVACAACPITVKKALTKVEGVQTAEVSYEKKEAVESSMTRKQTPKRSPRRPKGPVILPN